MIKDGGRASVLASGKDQKSLNWTSIVLKHCILSRAFLNFVNFTICTQLISSFLRQKYSEIRRQEVEITFKI